MADCIRPACPPSTIKTADKRSRTIALSDEKQCFEDSATRKTTRAVSEGEISADPDRLAAMLRAIPAEHRAAFLRGLAAMLDGQEPNKGLDTPGESGDNE